MSYIPLKRKLATSVREQDGVTYVRLYETDILSFDENYIILNTGGWYTATTKKRLNQAAQEFGLDFYVSQKDGEWFVTYRGEKRNFIDGEALSRKNAEVLQ